jgi:hypothetical protein
MPAPGTLAPVRPRYGHAGAHCRRPDDRRPNETRADETSPDDLFEAMGALAADAPLPVTVLRGAEERTVTIAA